MATSTQSVTAPPSDAVVRKIQLLLNLAARPGTEEEGAAAMARAQEILARYNLDLATVQDKVVAGGTAEREAEQKRDYARVKRSAMYKWQQKLVRTLAEANYCIYWVEEVKEKLYVPPSNRKGIKDPDLVEYDERGRTDCWVKRHKILGRTANTTGVMIMVDYLLDTIERLLPYPQAERLSRNANLWREGCSDRLCERIAAKAEAMRKPDYTTQGEAAYCTAIQVADLAKKEAAANYDFQHGAGSWARKEAREAEMELYWSAEAVAKRAEEREARRAKEREALLASETPEQRARREKREREEAAKAARRSRRHNEQYWARAEREAEREEQRKGSAAYRAGQAKGGDIGLDGQISAGKEQGRLG